MKNLNLLSRSEMKKVLGGDTEYPGTDCTKTCTCDTQGTLKDAVVKNCDPNTCNTEGNGATCLVGGTTTGQSCATVCDWEV